MAVSHAPDTEGGIAVKRVYEDPSATDGRRVLVDRLWPRGLSREAARIDDWMRDIAPSAALRQWFAHDPDRWVDFERQYREELDQSAEAAVLLDALAGRCRRGPVTLVYAARDTDHNNAVVLRKILRERLGSPGVTG